MAGIDIELFPYLTLIINKVYKLFDAQMCWKFGVLYQSDDSLGGRNDRFTLKYFTLSTVVLFPTLIGSPGKLRNVISQIKVFWKSWVKSFVLYVNQAISNLKNNRKFVYRNVMGETKFDGKHLINFQT